MKEVVVVGYNTTQFLGNTRLVFKIIHLFSTVCGESFGGIWYNFSPQHLDGIVYAFAFSSSSNSLALVKALATRPAGMVTIPTPIIRIKKVKIRPPEVMG